MGILDDAIREHLELKRSHGAADAEVRRQEEEVFGPARSDLPASAVAEEHTQLLSPADADELEPAPEDPYVVHPGDDLVPDPEEPATPPHGDEMSHAAEAGAGLLEPHEVDPGPPSGPHPHHHDDEQHPALVDHDHIGGEEHAPEPVFRHSAEAPPIEAPPVEDPPVEEPPIEEPPVEAPGDDDEDVLEDTPEFLQDAPEHDRLWFEQKPPRDFDFGE